MPVKATLINPIRFGNGYFNIVTGYIVEYGIKVTSPLIEGIVIPWTNIKYYKDI